MSFYVTEKRCSYHICILLPRSTLRHLLWGLPYYPFLIYIQFNLKLLFAHFFQAYKTFAFRLPHPAQRSNVTVWHILEFLKFAVCNPCWSSPSSPSFTTLAPLWFPIISLIFSVSVTNYFQVSFNSSFYSCRPSDLAAEWQRGWS